MDTRARDNGWRSNSAPLSPGRGDLLLPHWKRSPNGEAAAAMENGLPLLGGEGRGEGGRFLLLNSLVPA